MIGFRTRGFTLIEIVVTVAIVGLLAATAAPLVELGVRRGKEAELRTALRTIRSAIDDYKRVADDGRIEMEIDDSGYPESLTVLVSGIVDAKDPDGRKIYFLRRLPRDPFYPDTSADPEETWGLRAYDSDPEDPKPGDDVFDVFSQSRGAGLNGVPYNQW
jgi:general secretion pathway protein G